jgi:polysaccharide deacetylase family protein (PEP-CTERM system associated)
MLSSGTATPINAFTVDLEDWYQGLEIGMESWNSFENRLAVGTQCLLELLSEADVKATFFVLGYAAEQAPDLVREIQRQGHEIATHGYSHQFVYKLGPQGFRADLMRSLEVLDRIVKGPFQGHRAPFFSITKEADWAFEILAECGVLYDSSVFPVHNYRYGIADAPRWFYQACPGLLECPLPVYRTRFANIPLGGGAYFRLFPYTFTRYGMRKINDAGHAAVFYLHPWELDPEQPRIRLPRRIALTHYHNLAGTRQRLRRLLAEFHFTTMQRMLKNYGLE